MKPRCSDLWAVALFLSVLPLGSSTAANDEASVATLADFRVTTVGPEESAAASPQPAGDPLAPLAPLVGGRWRGQIRLLDGNTIEAINVWEWGNNTKTVHFRAYGLVAGREQLFYEGLYYWLPSQQKIVFREVSASGSVNEGWVEPEGETLHLEWTQYGSDGQSEYHEDLRFAGPDHYTSRARKKTPKGWEPATQENSFSREAAVSAQPSERVLRKEVVLDARLAEVWKAWTTTEGVTSFFGPGARVEAVVGGPYEIYFSLNAPEGLRGSEGCKVHTVVPMRLFAFEWNHPPSQPTLRGVHTVVFLRFEALASNQVRVELTHSGWGVGEEWDKAYAHFDPAWDAVLGNLRYRFAVGPVDWPDGTFRAAQLPAKPE